MSQIIFIDKFGKRASYDFATGETILAVARRCKVDIEGACDGGMACSTCHVIIDAAWYGLLPKARVEESDMLDLAAGVTRTSRLGCQIVLTDRFDGMIVKLP